MIPISSGNWELIIKYRDFLYECQKDPAVVGLNIPKDLSQSPQTIQIKDYLSLPDGSLQKRQGTTCFDHQHARHLVLMWLHWTRANSPVPSIPHHTYFNPLVEIQFSQITLLMHDINEKMGMRWGFLFVLDYLLSVGA